MEPFKKKKSLLLGGILSNDLPGVNLVSNEYRKYVSSYTTSCQLQKNYDSSIKSIMYEVAQNGTFEDYGKKISKQYKDNSLTMISQSFKVLSIFDDEIVSLHKKISNFSGKYEFMDLSGIVFNLALGIAEFNNTGKLSIKDLRRGKAISIRSLKTAFDPVTSSSNSVFIPKLTNRIMNPATFCAIAASANAYGSTVYTDIIEVDGTNATITVDFSNGALFEGCLEGIRLIMFMMDKMDCGSLSSFAFTKGLHTLNTVVGHSDEGGIFRDIMREGEFCPPFGAIYFDDSNDFIGFPVPSASDLNSVCAVVDSILLLTAAGVSQCDPCVSIEGRVYPTISVAPDCSSVIIDTDSEEKKRKNKDAFYAKYHKNNLLKISNKFFANYKTFLSNVFGLCDSNDSVIGFMQRSLLDINESNNRHLSHETIAPYFFIEPTTLFSEQYDSVAENNGYGPISFLNQDTNKPMFENVGLMQDMGEKKLLCMEFRNPRNSGLMLHLNQHHDNGLANFIPFNFIDSNFSLCGGEDFPKDKRDAKKVISDYFWGRGQSSVFAPAESNYIGKTISMLVSFSSFNSETYDTNLTHVPHFDELGGNVNIKCSRPVRIPNGKLGSFNKKMKKDRTLATIALQEAYKKIYAYNITGGFSVIPSNTEPLLINILPYNVDVKGGMVPGTIIESKFSRGPTNSIKYEDDVLKIRTKEKPSVETVGIEFAKNSGGSPDTIEKIKDLLDVDKLSKDEQTLYKDSFKKALSNIKNESGSQDSKPVPQEQ